MWPLRLIERIRRVRRLMLATLVPEFIWPEYVLIDNARIAVRGTPYSFGIKRYLSHLDYENAERLLVARLVQQGDHVLEMGGSIGILTAVLAERIGPSGTLVSIEADRRLTLYSSGWLKRYSYVTVLQGFAFPVLRTRNKVRATFIEGEGGNVPSRVER